jgi:hypothetical protein
LVPECGVVEGSENAIPATGEERELFVGRRLKMEVQWFPDAIAGEMVKGKPNVQGISAMSDNSRIRHELIGQLGRSGNWIGSDNT